VLWDAIAAILWRFVTQTVPTYEPLALGQQSPLQTDKKFYFLKWRPYMSRKLSMPIHSCRGGGKWKKSYLIPTLRSENHADVLTECFGLANASALWMLQPCGCFNLADASTLRMLQPCGCFSLLYGENGEKRPTQSQPRAFSAKHQKQLCHLIGVLKPNHFSLYHFVAQNLNSRILPEVTLQADACVYCLQLVDWC